MRGYKLGAAELPRLIQAVRGTLGALGQGPAEEVSPRPEPAVPVWRSVFRDAIVCLECGGRFRVLRRHLASDHGLTPQGYRARWELPGHYPLVSDYAEARSRVAKETGLGRKRAPEAEAPEDGAEGQEAAPIIPEPEPEPAFEAASGQDEDTAPAPAPKRRGRRKAAAPPDAE